MTEVCIETQPRVEKKVIPVQSVLVILISRRLIMSASRLVVTSSCPFLTLPFLLQPLITQQLSRVMIISGANQSPFSESVNRVQQAGSF